MNHPAAALEGPRLVEHWGRGEFPFRMVEAAFAAGAGVALAGALAHWGFGVELGLGAGILVSAVSALFSALTGFMSAHR